MSMPVNPGTPGAPGSYTKVCWSCNSTITSFAEICPRCGVRQQYVSTGSDKRILPAAILSFCFGIFGVHRFYAGKVGTGVLQLLTLGGLGIWMLVDLIILLTENFKDGNGRKLVDWT